MTGAEKFLAVARRNEVPKKTVVLSLVTKYKIKVREARRMYHASVPTRNRKR